MSDPLAGLGAAFGIELQQAVERELRMGFELEKQMAFARQRRLAQANRRNPRRMMDGFGQVTMSIDPALRTITERQFGRGCFKDKRFVHELLRDNPELRVPVDRKTIVAGWR